MDIKRFQFEALQALKLINDGILEVYEDVRKKKYALHAIANSSFKIENQNMDVVNPGDRIGGLRIEGWRGSDRDGRKGPCGCSSKITGR